MSSSLEMLTKAVDFVETQDKQKRLRESPSPTSENRKTSNHCGEPKPRDTRDTIENGVSHTNGTSESRGHEHVSRNATIHPNHPKDSIGVDLARSVNNHVRKGNNKEDEKLTEENSSSDRRTLVHSGLSEDQARYYLYNHKSAEQANGVQSRGERELRPEEQSTAAARPSSTERYPPAFCEPTSPTAERGGDTQPVTKPMVSLQHPAATILSSVGSAHTVPISNPQLHAPAMHHPYMYSLMYPAGAALDPTLSALGRVPGALKDGEGQASPPNGSPNAGLPTGTAGMHFPAAAFMHPLAASQALLMGARPPGTMADISPLLLAQSSAYQVPVFADQYKRMLEGLPQIPTAYSLHPQLADQYLKSLTGQGLDGSKDALALSGLAGRVPPGLSLAALQGQPGANDLLLRYSDLGLLRPQDGLSPRSASPYANKRRTESPVVSNANKIATSYPYHPPLTGSQLNSLSGPRTHARSPANAFTQSLRSRSPVTEARKPEAERSGFRSHSRDLDRDSKPSNKDLASTSTSGNHIRTNEEHLAAHSYSVTDPTGRKIPLPPFYSGPSVHVPQAFSLGLPVHRPGHDRSPSPHSRQNEERGYHRPSRDRSPVAEMQSKRRSLESQYVARNSPLLNDRHNSRPTSPTNNGQMPPIRVQLPLVNGSAEAAAELAKASSHLLLSTNHTRSPNAGAFVGEGRDQRSGSPPAIPYLPAAGLPYFNPQLLGGLGPATGAPILLPPQYASLAKGDLASLYKSGENVAEYSRIAGLSPLHLLSAPALAAGRGHALSQDYAAGFKSASNPYFSAPAGSKESGKASPANGKDKIPGVPHQLHPGILQQSPQSMSPAKVSMKPKHSPSPQHTKSSSHHSHTAESRSPTPGAGSSALSSSESHRFHSPNLDRPAREVSPKPVSNKPYRPNPMLRQHAEDLERNRKRKLEEAMREESYMHEKSQPQPRSEQREYSMKDARKDPKRRKQLITGEPEHDVEEHFRKSLGKDYREACNKVSVSGSVDDHFKKSLGDRWESSKVRTAANSMPVKSESRDSAPHTAHVLPSYTAAISQTVRGFPAHPDSKESVQRMYDQVYMRERYNMAATARKGEKSPPRLPASSTVLYPHPPIGPVKQKVKARNFIPEAPQAAPDMTNSNRSARSSSLGSKGSSRSISGSSAESIPVALSKSSPASSPTSVAESVPRPALPVISSTIPFTFAHHQGVPISAAVPRSNPHEPPTEHNSTARHRSSPTSPRAPVSDESTRNQNSPQQSFHSPAVSTKESAERRKSEEGRPST